MVALQASIGILNDIVDAPRDAGRVPPKPISGGSVAPGVARGALLVMAGIGILLSASIGPTLVFLSFVVLAIGAVYDLALKGTAWSWLPFALGIPVLPVFGWLGASPVLPSFFVPLVTLAVLAGAGLAIANARADEERDRAAGGGSVAIALGLAGSWWLGSGLLAVVAVSALVVVLGPGAPARPAGLGLALMAGGIAGITAGAALGRAGDPDRRERAWETQAIAVAILAAGYLVIVTAYPPG